MEMAQPFTLFAVVSSFSNQLLYKVFFFGRKPNFIKRNAQSDRGKRAFSKKHLTHKVPIHAIVES